MAFSQTMVGVIVAGIISTAAGTLIVQAINSGSIPSPVPSPGPKLIPAPEETPEPPRSPGPGEDKYVIPAGATIEEFVRCLQSRTPPLIENKDFTIKEFSLLVRVVIPISPDAIVSEGYESCRLKVVRRQ